MLTGESRFLCCDVHGDTLHMDDDFVVDCDTLHVDDDFVVDCNTLLRDRPFNLQGRGDYGFLFVQKYFFSDNTS